MEHMEQGEWTRLKEHTFGKLYTSCQIQMKEIAFQDMLILLDEARENLATKPIKDRYQNKVS